MIGARPSYSRKRKRAKACPEPKKHDAFEVVSLSVGILGLVVLIAYTGATFWQVRLLKQQISDARTSSADSSRQTDRALKLADTNAEVAKGQLATAQDTERRQLRAYVYLVDGTTTFKPNLQRGWDIRPTWKNSGNTPAMRLTVETHCGEDLADVAKPAGLTHIIGTRIVGPQQDISGTSCIASTRNMQDVKAGRSYFVLMRARYFDVFGTSRITEECFSITRVTSDPMDLSHDLGYEGKKCPGHNCVDEDCKAAK